DQVQRTLLGLGYLLQRLNRMRLKNAQAISAQAFGEPLRFNLLDGERRTFERIRIAPDRRAAPRRQVHAVHLHRIACGQGASFPTLALLATLLEPLRALRIAAVFLDAAS